VPVIIEQAKIINNINKMTPHPTPVQEQPLPNPNLFCNQSKSQSSNNNFNKPEKQPGLEFIAFSFEIMISLSRFDIYTVNDSPSFKS
jgi:hypothetical protein